MIAEPPVDAGATHVTTAEPVAFAEVAVVADTAVGAPGVFAGVATPDATDGTPVPAEFVALTVNVYEVPLVKPKTVQEVPEVVHVSDPGVDVTV